MTAFQITALALTAAWLALVGVKFRRSTIVLIGGLVVVSAYTAIAISLGRVSAYEVFGSPDFSWLGTLGFAFVWLGLMLAYSPLADWIASRIFEKPPTLRSFRAIRESLAKLIAGIVVAWVLGGVLEELVFRGIVLKSIAELLFGSLPSFAAIGVAIITAAAGAGLIHYYQGPRAMVIITQLSILFGVLFVISGYNLWAVILCHGFYDTIAFIRFARGTSKYSKLDRDTPAAIASK
jgi:membrane protease YdiL (CAAX protease family)